MNKKTLWIIVGAVVIIAAIIGLSVWKMDSLPEPPPLTGKVITSGFREVFAKQKFG